MAVRTEMSSLVAITQRYVSDAASTTWTSDQIQERLDAHRADFDYMPMWHDSDYHIYRAQQRAASARQLAESETRQLAPVTYDVPDFGSFYKVGYLANDWAIRSSPSETTAATSPNVVDVISATFTFSTAPNQELYLRGTGYNVWLAAADLLMETPDTGREYDTARTRGQVGRTIKQKWESYQIRGWALNRRRHHLALV